MMRQQGVYGRFLRKGSGQVGGVITRVVMLSAAKYLRIVAQLTYLYTVPLQDVIG